MKKISLAILLLYCLGATAKARQEVPALLVHAAHCLAVKDFLPPSNAGNLTLGYILDERSYPGDRIIYIVAYASPSRSNGWIFAVFLTENSRHEAFNIQNNAEFTLSQYEPIGVLFTDPPLGGDWTREHLASAIREIERQPKFTISFKDLSAAEPCSCRSYTDPQPKSTPKR